MDDAATPLSSDSFCTKPAESKMLGSPSMIIVFRTAAVSPAVSVTNGGDCGVGDDGGGAGRATTEMPDVSERTLSPNTADAVAASGSACRKRPDTSFACSAELASTVHTTSIPPAAGGGGEVGGEGG